MSFTRTIENFTCEHCGADVTGNGYTNHCPHCLWSKHVDIDPGDRKAQCGGMMKPIAVTAENGTYVLTQRCERCGHERKNKIAPEDDMRAVALISRQTSYGN